MQRRSFLKAAAAQAALLPEGVHGVSPRPNFLFLIADDLTFRGIHALNNREIRTPNLDRLAQRGCAFTHCFHQGSWSGAVCVRQPHHAQHRPLRVPRPTGVETSPLWGETLGAAGYDTSIAGKWHLSQTTLRRSFQEIGPVSPGMFESGPEAYHRPSPETRGRRGTGRSRGSGCTRRSGRERSTTRSNTRRRFGRKQRRPT